MKCLEKISMTLFFFVWVPLCCIGTLAATAAMPTTGTKLAWLGFGVLGSVCFALGLTNVLAQKLEWERKLAKIAIPAAGGGVLSIVLCGVFYLCGV
jgi:hypothetical protein